jgi:predicted NBD/HSP70 family sugar kinase
MDRATVALRVALDNLVERLEPEVVSVGGGVVNQLPRLIDAATMPRVTAGLARPTKESPSVSIERSQRGDDAGVIGAALLAIT